MILRPVLQPVLRPVLRSPLEAGYGYSLGALFAGGRQGAWYDPPDVATVYQDSAGTTAGVIGNPVGKRLDKSGNGNHASQATSTSRPKLSARYNLFEKTDALTDAYWNKATSNGTAAPVVTDNYAADPDGGNKASRVQITLPGDTEWALVRRLNLGLTVKAGQKFRQRIGLKANGPAQVGKIVSLYTFNSTTTIYEEGIQCVLTDEWKFFENDVTFDADSSAQEICFGKARGNAPNGAAQTNATAATDFLVYAPDFRTADDAALNIPAYQRVNTATDYDTAGFPLYDEFDGADDFLTSATGGGGSAGFFYCAAIYVGGGAGTTRGLWSDVSSNSGRRVVVSSSNNLVLLAGNGATFSRTDTAGTLPVGEAHVVMVYDDGTNLGAQIDNGAVATAARPAVAAGTTSFTEGRANNGATDYFQGRLYSRVFLNNSCPDAATRELVKRRIAAKAGISLV